jgi:O-antigen ligase
MIRVHPLIGVGWGNYAIVRNDPEYRGGSAWADVYDAPGLGLLGTAAEVGVPLTLFLVAVFFYPYFYLRRMGAPLVVRNLALMQPVIHIFGGQLNLTHPWLLSAFALGLGYFYSRRQLVTYPSEPQPGGVLPRSASMAVPAK